MKLFNYCQQEFVNHVKTDVFPSMDFGFTGTPRSSPFLFSVVWRSGNFNFILCCLYFKDGKIKVPDTVLEHGKIEGQQMFYLIGTGGNCSWPKKKYLVPVHRMEKYPEISTLERFKMI